MKEAEKSKKRDEHMTQLLLLNSSNMRLCGAAHRADQKLQNIITADNRLRALTIPVPTILSPVLDLLPVKSKNNLLLVERLLSSENNENDATKFKDELVCTQFITIFFCFITIYNLYFFRKLIFT